MRYADAMLVCRKEHLSTVWDNNTRGEWVVLALRPCREKDILDTLDRLRGMHDPNLVVVLSFSNHCEGNWKRFRQFLDATEVIRE